MDKLSSKFANVLHTLNIQKGDSVFTLLGRQPELYITAFGSLKKGVVFCPMFSVFGPEPVWQRL
jgi:acetyl-CoA synthetase